MKKKSLDLLEGYNYVKHYVMNSGFQDEIEWQANVDFETIDESDFLRESAWVILCSGMRESIVRRCFKNISFCFLGWESAKKIVDLRQYCVENALNIFNNYRKINAIAETAKCLVDIKFNKLKIILKNDSIKTLQTFPFMGPITSYHLAKNLGLPVAKGDRHLTRLCSSLGYPTVQNLCEVISEKSGDSVSVVDIVFWRFATLRRDYIEEFLCRCKVRGDIL